MARLEHGRSWLEQRVGALEGQVPPSYTYTTLPFTCISFIGISFVCLAAVDELEGLVG